MQAFPAQSPGVLTNATGAKLIEIKTVLGGALPRVWVAIALLWYIGTVPAARAVTGEQIVESVRTEVAATPDNAAAILKAQLGKLPKAERIKFAAAVLAAAVERPQQQRPPDCERVLRAFRAAVAASPQSVIALMDVAYRACPDSLLAIRDAALEETSAAGFGDLAADIIAHGATLAEASRTTPSVAPLGGTINPGNVGGGAGSEKQKKDKKEKKEKSRDNDVSPS